MFRFERRVFVGYDDSTKGYRIYLPHKRLGTVNRDVTFDESRVYRSDPLEAQFDIQKLLELHPMSSTMSHAIPDASVSALGAQTPSPTDLLSEIAPTYPRHRIHTSTLTVQLAPSAVTHRARRPHLLHSSSFRKGSCPTI